MTMQVGHRRDVIRGVGHLLIGGTGRAGTTLLVQILTYLDFDTGFSKEEVATRVDTISRAGLEWRLHSKKPLPYVIKSPWLSDDLESPEGRELPIEAAIVPFRDLFEAAESRRHVYRQVESLGRNPGKHPGTLWKTAVPSEQEAILSQQFYRLLQSLIVRDVPIYFLHFPRFVESADYLYDRLETIFTRHGVPREAVVEAHGKLADPAHVTRFVTPHGIEPSGMAGATAEPAQPVAQNPASGTDAYLSPASFWWPAYLEGTTGVEQTPLIFWLMEAARPAIVVGLGDREESSYFAFCQAVTALGLGSRCYRVLPSTGERRATPTKLAEAIHAYNDRHYATVSRVLHATPGAVASELADGSVDLLFLGRMAESEDALNCFDIWQPKLSARALVLLHGIGDREADVFHIWEQLRVSRPSLALPHGAGLGIVAYGAVPPNRLSAFLAISVREDMASDIRMVYAHLGKVIQAHVDHRRAEARAAARWKLAEARSKDIEATLASREERLARLTHELQRQKERVREQADALRKLKQTFSWRVTAPLRWCRKRLGRFGHTPP